MREIKFRGKKIGSSEWVYGDLLINNGLPIIVKQVNRNYIGMVHVRDGCHWHIETPAFRVDPETVGQYTGLNDKNGKEIYEGDVVVSFKEAYEDTPSKNKVEYKKGCFKLSTNGLNDIPLFNYRSEELEVIGNIHDNPELLDK